MKTTYSLVGEFLLTRLVNVITPRVINGGGGWSDTSAEGDSEGKCVCLCVCVCVCLECFLTRRHFHGQELVPVKCWNAGIKRTRSRRPDDTSSRYQRELGGTWGGGGGGGGDMKRQLDALKHFEF